MEARLWMAAACVGLGAVLVFVARAWQASAAEDLNRGRAHHKLLLAHNDLLEQHNDLTTRYAALRPQGDPEPGGEDKTGFLQP
jgi:hypothetical protein